MTPHHQDILIKNGYHLYQINITNEADTKEFSYSLAQSIYNQTNYLKIYLSGNLGAGKTTFARYFLNALGINEPIKSPTYTLIEEYTLINTALKCLHADLYRLNYPEELYDLGIFDYLESLWLIEWPEKAGDLLPLPEIWLNLIRNQENQRQLTVYLSEKINPLFINGLNSVLL